MEHAQKHQIFDAFNENYIKDYFDVDTGGFLVIHVRHGLNEVKANKIIGLQLAKRGEQVILLENDENKISADSTRNGVIWEFKTFQKAQNLRGAVQKTLRLGKKQANNVLCFIDQPYKKSEIIGALYNVIKFDFKKELHAIAILFRNNHLIEITREEIIDESFVAKFH
jgi:Contact-dependent growth inhibition CdiA C-terminal domain